MRHFLCAVGLLLWLAAAASPWQKPADPPATLNPVTAASAKDTAPAKDSAAPKPTGFPNTGESLNYSLNWPTGASLGEAHLQAAKSSRRLAVRLFAERLGPRICRLGPLPFAGERRLVLAGAGKADHARLSASTHEKTVFDYQEGSATRTTLVEGGGHTDIDINDCAHDGLDYVFFARRELGQGTAFRSSRTCCLARRIRCAWNSPACRKSR